MATEDNPGVHNPADAAGTQRRCCAIVRRALGVTAPILILSTCLLFGTPARAQNGGYMRVLTSHGQLAGESTDPKYNGWILLQAATMPSAAQIAAMADEAATGAGGEKAVHKPVIVVKDQDQSSLALLGASTSHQHYPEVDIILTSPGGTPVARYKLSDATILSIRAGDTGGGTHEAFEQVKIGYTKIELEQ
jgi:type VI protein secretion system component Hcp